MLGRLSGAPFHSKASSSPPVLRCVSSCLRCCVCCRAVSDSADPRPRSRECSQKQSSSRGKRNGPSGPSCWHNVRTCPPPLLPSLSTFFRRGSAAPECDGTPRSSLCLSDEEESLCKSLFFLVYTVFKVWGNFRFAPRPLSWLAAIFEGGIIFLFSLFAAGRRRAHVIQIKTD
jgi:hypothetical protein